MALKKIFGFIFFTLISYILAYTFNYFFLALSLRDDIDKALMQLLLTSALTFIFFMLWLDGIEFNFRFKRIGLSIDSLRDNLPGIVLALVFLLIYFYYGRILNEFKQVDNLFDADVSSWMRRISSPNVKNFEMRGPHPFTYFIFQPFGRFLNLFTGDPSLSAILFNCATGGAGVFIMWLLIKCLFENKTYASLITVLFGISSSQLFFGSVIDTYVFSAFALILFLLLVQKDNISMSALVAGGILTFGITLTNFIQNFFAYLSSRPRFKDIIRFTGWVIAISLVLTYVHAAIFPSSKLFFLTPDIENEEKFFTNVLNAHDWYIKGRLFYLIRTILLYSVIAPKVFILTTEVGSILPEFRFYKISIGTFHQASYDGLGQVLIFIWAAMLFVSGMAFIWKLFRNKKFDINVSLMMCLAFNFIIHIVYGQELFLYSSDWTYALILFIAYGLYPISKNKLFHIAMMLFLIALAFHQWNFMNTIVTAITGISLPPS